MATINQTKITCPTDGNRPLGGTAALRTGLFQSIDNLDPDIVRLTENHQLGTVAVEQDFRVSHRPLVPAARVTLA